MNFSNYSLALQDIMTAFFATWRIRALYMNGRSLDTEEHLKDSGHRVWIYFALSSFQAHTYSPFISFFASESCTIYMSNPSHINQNQKVLYNSLRHLSSYCLLSHIYYFGTNLMAFFRYNKIILS